MYMIVDDKYYKNGYGTRGFSAVFFVDIVLNFFVEKEIQDPEVIVIERSIKKISLIYLSQGFVFDLVTILPLYECLKSILVHSEFLLLIKVLRFKNGIKALNANSYIKTLRVYAQERVETMVNLKMTAANNKRENNTYIS
jgi:hypothetical protein